jgi:hypothetical protein
MSGLQVLAGMGAVLGATVAGSAVGAATGPALMPCSPDSQDLVQVCGSTGGAAVGAAYGILGAGVAGAAVAAFSPTYRVAGLSAFGTVAALVLVGWASCKNC